MRIDGLRSTSEVTVELLGYEGPVRWRQEGGSLVIVPPLMSPDEVPSPYAFVFKIGGALQ